MTPGIEDSGGKVGFESGAWRDIREGKGRFDLISPWALMRLAKHLELGAEKYGIRNWEKGIPLHTFIDSALRHLTRYLMDKLLEREPAEDHLAAAMWNVMCAIHTEDLITLHHFPDELDDIAYQSPGPK